MYYGQAEQDKFVLETLKNKRKGIFVEIGSNHPININNTYLLESSYNWKGLMVEYNRSFLPLYQQYRPKSRSIINDARMIDYKQVFEEMDMPPELDYLQIDLEADNGSTIKVIELFDDNIFPHYKFATVTFEHDIYHTNYADTRNVSRKIFEKHGYYRVFDDINNQGANPYEDWYVHPELVDMGWVADLQQRNEKYYKTIEVKEIGEIASINWQDIEY